MWFEEAQLLRRERRRAPAFALMATLLLAGCATGTQFNPAPSGVQTLTGTLDPLEPWNRGLFGIGRMLDKVVARPAAVIYQRLIPRRVRDGLHNALQNSDEPLVAVNDLLQGHAGKGARALARFATNSTIGLAGLFDPATGAGLSHHDNGFASTLRRYGVPSGPYLFVPVIGPSTLRGVVGEAVDYMADPLSLPRYSGMRAVNVARTTISLLDQRAADEREIQALFASAADPYATTRSVFLQAQQSEQASGEPALEDLPELPLPAPETSAPAESPSPSAASPR
jgi:phospholipid-binding lipoprotein MlaA